MKITIDIDCTPQEARTFFGLPEIENMQKAVVEAMQEKMVSSIKTMDAESLMNTWMPLGMKGFEQMQKAFWAQYRGGKGSSES